MKSYQELLKDVIDNGVKHQDRTGVGTVSVFGRQWRHSMSNGFPLLTTKKVHFKSVVNELLWFLSGSTNNKDLEATGCTIWREWATAEQCAKFGREEGDLGPVYGQLWRNFGGSRGKDGVDQIKSLIEEIEVNPNSRRLIVSGWHPLLQSRVALPPCHTLWQVKCYPDQCKMSLSLYARSIDIFLGLAFNIASYALLLKLLAKVTGYLAHELIISFGDLHLYNNHFEQARIQLERDPLPLPSLKINDRLAGGGFDALMDCKFEDIILSNYASHPAIKAEVAV